MNRCVKIRTDKTIRANLNEITERFQKLSIDDIQIDTIELLRTGLLNY